MAANDFDVESLAEYLHLSAAQVLRMVERGQLPGRKIGGQWRFPEPEIHHWLEQRIGLSDEGELVQMEEVLQKSPSGLQRERLTVAELLPVEAIQVPLAARTRRSVITAMTQVVARTGLLWDAPKMAEAVLAREQLHPTALDDGVALLHPRRPQSSILAEGVIALGRTYQGIPFGGRTLTDVFFLIASTSDAEHLQILARLSRLIADPLVLETIRESEDPVDIHRQLAQREAELP